MVAEKEKEKRKPFEQVVWELLMRDAIDWENLNHQLKDKWRRQVKVFLVAWLETEFKQQLFNPEITKMALGVLKVATERKNTPPEIIRRVVASFVVDIIDPQILDKKKRLIIPE